MANKTIDQNVPTLQERHKKLLQRIAHVQLLIDQLKEEIISMGDHLPNKIINKMLELENARHDLADAVKKQQDMQLQQESEPLTIKEDRSENKT